MTDPFADSTQQPKVYCILSPEASEDDRSRLDGKVRPLDHRAFGVSSEVNEQPSHGIDICAGFPEAVQWSGEVR